MAFFTDLGRFPEASDSALHPAMYSLAAGGRSLAARLPAMFCNMYMANNFYPSVLPWHVDQRSSCLLPHNRASLISVREIRPGGGGRGLTARQKRKSSLLRPPLPIFPGSRSLKGGGGVTAGSTVQEERVRNTILAVMPLPSTLFSRK